MASVRRRKYGKDEDALTESLLPDYAEQSNLEEEERQRHANRHAIIVHPGEFNLQAFIQSILDWWNRLFGQIVSYASQLWPYARDQPLSLLQVGGRGIPYAVLYLSRGIPYAVLYLSRGIPYAVLYLSRGIPYAVLYLSRGIPYAVLYLSRGIP
ncbi:hypothetical protein Agub_g489 [Astrephomene gubernaculifera]|uniref:Uncharacterized protein n=1 Tax=Astrephomene gubernaculifera TaxID=47775 RepID=A0AAD3HGX5_9CHLO|nr:hypothetical protein Agub_g489 [Astrephomene gubernaculifera]